MLPLRGWLVRNDAGRPTIFNGDRRTATHRAASRALIAAAAALG